MRRLGLALVIALMALPTVAMAAPPQLPDHAAEKVAAAHAHAQQAAANFAAEKARGHAEDKTTGLARAAEVSNSWRFTGADKPGNGNGRALGAGHANAVHEALAAGQSPASLNSHGKAVSAAAAEMQAAFEKMKTKPDGHPGRGQGKGLGGPGGDS